MARPRKDAQAPVQEAKKPGRPKKAEPAVDPDISRIRDTVRCALSFINNRSVDDAERIGYLGRCVEELASELSIFEK
jgi:hypothetical protein